MIGRLSSDAARALACAVFCIAVCGTPDLRAQTQGELELSAIDKDTGQPVAVRVHLKDSQGRAIKPRGVPAWNDHFVFFNRIVLRLRPGVYTFEMERGPEYRLVSGNFQIRRGATDNKQVAIERFVDMKKEGWWSGELHVHRPVEDAELLMLAEDLHVAPIITWWNARNLWADTAPPEPLLTNFDGNRFYHVMGGEDERGGGALLYFNHETPLPIAGAQREYPSPVAFLELVRDHPHAHVDVEKPFWWDMPAWVATGQVDSIGLANNHMHRDGMLANEAWGKPRDRERYPDPHGNGRWSQDIYYHLLNCGMHLPPSAGSASGVLANPVGYNRVYVHCGDALTYESWWEGLRAGRVVVTNGPLMRPRVNGQLPGHVFYAEPGERVELNIELNLSLRDKVDYLEIVKDGRVQQEVRLDEFKERRGKLPAIEFDESGWMLIRAVTSNPDTYRFASTGPYYVDIGGRKRISRASARFFVDWVKERIERLENPPNDNPRRSGPPLTPEQLRDVLAPQHAALKFWTERLEAATAD